MMKYSEITLTDEEKKILEWFKEQGYTHVGRTTQYGFVEVIDENNDIRCNLKPMRKPFEFIEKGERYEIDKLLNPPHEPKTVWELKKGDTYWWINIIGEICKDVWCDFYVDKQRRNQGNVFLTKEEVEFESKRREVYEKVRKYSRPFIVKENNYYPYYDWDVHTIKYSLARHSYGFFIYFNSLNDIRKAIEEVGEEDFKKYYLGVTE